MKIQVELYRYEELSPSVQHKVDSMKARMGQNWSEKNVWFTREGNCSAQAFGELVEQQLQQEEHLENLYPTVHYCNEKTSGMVITDIGRRKIADIVDPQ